MADFFTVWMRIFFLLLIIVWLTVYIIKMLRMKNERNILAGKTKSSYSLNQLKEVK